MPPTASLKTQLKKVPDSPGVYLWKDAAGEVLYVGKAKSLAKRMASYVARDRGARTSMMMARAVGFDHITTANEVEALILEKTLIARHRPPFNVAYRDDKSYPFIAVTAGDEFARIVYTREKHKPHTRYFGPYTDAKAARATIDTLRRVFPLRTCKGSEPGKSTGTPCLMFHIERCLGPCIDEVTREEYDKVVAQVVRFLEGKEKQVLKELETEMHEASEALEFERAARLRNRIRAAERILEKQKVVAESGLDADIVGVDAKEGIACVELFQVRHGTLVASDAFVLDKGDEVPADELVRGWMLEYYTDASHVPRELVLSAAPPDSGAVAEWLSGLRHERGFRGRTRITVPARGDKARLKAAADENAAQSLVRYMTKTRFEETRANEALGQLASALGLPRIPLRIECFDISNIMGKQATGSMVVFTAGVPDKKQYRRFKVRLPGEPNDVAMMAEVLKRRFKRSGTAKTGEAGAEMAAEGPPSGGPEGAVAVAEGRARAARFATSEPDLVMVDGGLPQLGAARKVFKEMGLDGVALAALAKQEEELFTVGRAAPVRLERGPEGLHLVQRVRDEAHRFAIEYHRDLRGKAMTRSALDDIPGVGPVARRKLLRHFGSMAKIRAAGVEELRGAGITRPQAEAVRERLGAVTDR